jgi:hypothetical protein
MPTIQDELLNRIALAPQQYHRLILLLNSEHPAVTPGIEDIASQSGSEYVNLGLRLSEMLLGLTERQRILKLPQLVGQMIEGTEKQATIIDHIEILFQPVLQQDPLRLLQGLSRNQTILAVWNGQVVNGYLTYATPEHPEYRKYPTRDLNILPLTQELA